MRAVGCVRERKGDKPLAEQNKAFLEYCQSNGYEAAAVFLDASPTPDEVPGFRQLVEFLRNQRQHGVLLVTVPDLGGLGDHLTEAGPSPAAGGGGCGRRCARRR